MADIKKAWSGTLKLGFVTQPVSVYAAADSKVGKVAFNQLHSTCGGRINQVIVCKACDEAKALAGADIVKGYEVTKGNYVQITAEELDACKVENTKVIDLKEFVPVTELSPLMIAESAFIAPALSDMAEAYVLIREALDGKAGIGILNHGNKEKLIAVVALGRGLVMHTLRHASEIRDVVNVPTLAKLPETADAKTVAMMKTLMASMESQVLDLEKYPNRYVENVQKLINAKAAGQAAPVVEKTKATVMDLAAMLEASIAAAAPSIEVKPKAKRVGKKVAA